MHIHPLNPSTLLCRGSFLHSLSDQEYQFFDDGILVLQKNKNAQIQIKELGNCSEIAQRYEVDPNHLPKNSGLMLPPFFDIHFHWVQDLVRHMPKISLLEWLNTYTFPEEAKFASQDYATVMAQAFWNKILSFGTIGGLCYSSIHETALSAAMKEAPAHFLIGNSLMTMNCPSYLQTDPATALSSVTSGIDTYGQRYVVTPRFAPTTHPDVMTAAAQKAHQHNIFQQTHMGETLAEIEWALSLYQSLPGFSDISSYADIYHRCGVLGPQTVLGHCIHLSPSEWECMAHTDTVIASCPTSNAPVADLGIGSGLFDFKKANHYGVRWGLASDIGGGPFLSMFDVMHSFVQQNHRQGHSDVSYTQALYRSSRANAAIMQLNKGNFTTGRDADWIRIRADAQLLSSGLSGEEILQNILQQVSERKERENLVEETVINAQSQYQRHSQPVC